MHRFKRFFASWAGLCVLIALATSFVIGSSFAVEGVKTLKQRSEIPDKYKWRLDDIYPNQAQWEKDFQAVEAMIPDMGKYKGTLAESPEKMLEFFQAREKLFLLFEKVQSYGWLLHDQDTRSQDAIAMRERMMSMGTKVGESISWVSPEIVAIPRDKIEKFLSSHRELAIYRHYLDNELRTKEHTLSPEEERIMALAGEVMSSPAIVSRTMRDTDIKFPAILDEDSSEVMLSEGRYYAFMQSPDRRVRRDAAEKLLKTYIGYKNTLASTMSANLAKDMFYTKARKYNSCLEASLDNDNVKVAVYENLIKSVSDNITPLHKYVELRRKFMALDDIHLYDMSAPLIPEVEEKVEYDQAVVMLKDGLKPLGSDYIARTSEGFESGWVDVYETEGKRTGAYSWGSYATHPYMLLNYNNTLDDVFAVAHEMGHSMHTYYTIHTQPYIYGDYSLFVAEVASTTNEAILMDNLLKKTKDPDKRLYLLSQWIDQIRGTVITQVMFADWEKQAHELAEAGEGITADALTKIYHDVLRKYYGPHMTYDDYYDYTWIRIPHFYRNFYVYKYATAYSASAAISQKILKKEKGAIEAYLNFLKSGSSDYPIETLKKAGVDMSTPAPVEATMKLFGRLVDDMDKLMQQKKAAEQKKK
ncbi:MAG: oligoendopeptidase F [bacterium]